MTNGTVAEMAHVGFRVHIGAFYRVCIFCLAMGQMNAVGTSGIVAEVTQGRVRSRGVRPLALEGSAQL